jgi:hypothetical protein
VREIAGLRLDPFRREVYRDGRYVALTRKQFAVLEVLAARSPTPCASQSRDCANASANPGSSPPSPASGTTSTLNRTAGVREETVGRAPGLSVRLKLTLSYAGFLMLAGVLMLAAAWLAGQPGQS